MGVCVCAGVRVCVVWVFVTVGSTNCERECVCVSLYRVCDICCESGQVIER